MLIPVRGIYFAHGNSVEKANEALDRITKGTKLVLARQPDNPKDPNAILVLWAGGKLGYVAREFTDKLEMPIPIANAKVAKIQRGGVGPPRVFFESEEVQYPGTEKPFNLLDDDCDEEFKDPRLEMAYWEEAKNTDTHYMFTKYNANTKEPLKADEIVLDIVRENIHNKEITECVVLPKMEKDNG